METLLDFKTFAKSIVLVCTGIMISAECFALNKCELAFDLTPRILQDSALIPFYSAGRVESPALHIITTEYEDQGSYLNTIMQLRSKLQSFAPQSANVERVVYPFIGADFGLAFLLFPDAKTVIGFDDHPLFSEHENLKDLTIAPNNGVRFRQTVQLDKTLGSGSLALGFLLRSQRLLFNRDVRIRTIERGRPVGGRDGNSILRGDWETEERHDSTARTEYPMKLTLIEFDFGPGTPVRKYVHIETVIYKQYALSSVDPIPPWKDWIDRFSPQALIAKAAHGSMGGIINRFRDWLTTLVGANLGVIVEGGTTLTPLDFEMFGTRTPWFTVPSQTKVTSEVWQSPAGDTAFSYGKFLRLFRFDREEAK